MSNAKILKSVTGMPDILPEDENLWNTFLDTSREVLRSYGYKRIMTPVVEPTGLFVRGIGEVTDVVEKEMYSFTDQLNGEELSLRPENTAGVVRSVIEHNLAYNAQPKLWYFGEMFRHERPQKGRYRQFHQLGIEAFGAPGPEIDAEQILLARRLFEELGILPLKLEINTLGTAPERARHREALIAHFEAHRSELDEDAARRLYSNPLRILDTKNPALAGVVESAPKLIDYLGAESLAFFDRLRSLLDACAVDYEVNPRLVRGLDYYSHTVYEWITDKLGAQATVCGGGRYDALVEMLGGKPTPGVGFAIGVERVLEVMRQTGYEDNEPETEFYVMHTGGATTPYAMNLAEIFRDAGYDVTMHPSVASFKSQMRRADASGASYALICGESELAGGTVTVKKMFGQEGERFLVQESVPVKDAIEYFVKIEDLDQKE